MDTRYLDKSVSSVLVALLSYLDPHRIFTVPYAAVFGVLTQSGSPAAANLVNDALSGGCTARNIQNNIYTLYEKVKDLSYVFPKAAVLLFSYDNLGGKGGYQLKSSRASLANNQEAFVAAQALITSRKCAFAPRN